MSYFNDKPDIPVQVHSHPSINASPGKYFNAGTYGYAVWHFDNWGTARGFQPYTGTLCYCPADNSATGGHGHVHVIAYTRR